jgi:septal ring factor EnvC (AmiA/AmiB activator)
MEFKEYSKLLQKSQAADPEQFAKDMAEDRRAAERREKAAERYDRMMQRAATDTAEDSQPRLKRSASHLAAAKEAGLKLTEDIKPVAKPVPASRGGSGRAANLDMDGGMRPGSPSLENPIKQAKGGKVTASSRADGIAIRGKTRGKIC